MITSLEEVHNEMRMLAEDARALLNATAGMSEEKIVETRKRLASALEYSSAVYGDEEANALPPVKVLDEMVRGHPYQAMGIALGIGAFLGSLLARRA